MIRSPRCCGGGRLHFRKLEPVPWGTMTTTVPAEQATEALRPRQPERNGATSWRSRMGANLVPGGVEFRVWAPDADDIDVQIDAMATPLVRDDAGIWSGVVPGIAAGVRYRYRLDGDRALSRPVLAQPARGPARPFRGRRSGRVRLARRGHGAARHRVASSSTSCTSGRSRPRARSTR